GWRAPTTRASARSSTTRAAPTRCSARGRSSRRTATEARRAKRAPPRISPSLSPHAVAPVALTPRLLRINQQRARELDAITVAQARIERGDAAPDARLQRIGVGTAQGVEQPARAQRIGHGGAVV